MKPFLEKCVSLEVHFHANRVIFRRDRFLHEDHFYFEAEAKPGNSEIMAYPSVFVMFLLFIRIIIVDDCW